MSVKPVNVTYHGNGVPLSVDPLDVVLADREQVQWRFHNLPANCIPFVFFPEIPGASGQPFGPFQYLEPSVFRDSETGLLVSRVLAIGNTGVHHEYPYTAMALDPSGAAATSHGHNARILNPSARENTSPDALVHYNSEAEPEHRFKVKPSPLVLEKERTAIWYVEGIPRDHFVSFHFDGFPEDPMKGPFLSFSLSRGFGSSWLANGAGFLSTLLGHETSQITAPIHYFVRLRNHLGEVVEEDDPVIEPLESPPGT
ncbi:MAG TPA: hypothetical protein VE685_01415 [Thermoanaerobaculia bacterium]|nr:hypothetical protein [Thermoanaerobaculia bacterium]